jgi:hypothetical protein
MLGLSVAVVTTTALQESKAFALLGQYTVINKCNNAIVTRAELIMLYLYKLSF